MDLILDWLECSERYTLRNGYEYAYVNVTPATFRALRVRLIANGYVEYDSAELDQNQFATYIKVNEQANLAYYPTLNGGTLKTVFTQKGYLPLSEPPAYQKCAIPTVTQLGRIGATFGAAGQLYVIQLEDGSFVLIDGGLDCEEDRKELLRFLQAKKPAQHAIPRVTWMFTHAHCDHVRLAIQFLNTCADQIELSLVCRNFPIFAKENCTVTDNNADHDIKGVALMDQILSEKYPNTPIFEFHSGQRLYLPGCRVDFLNTHEDCYPTKMWTLNQTSSAWKMSFDGGNSFLVLGDCEIDNCDQLAAVYHDALKCNMVQLTHHGLNGGTQALYEKLLPEICFWPIDRARFEGDVRCLGTYVSKSTGRLSYAFNAYLRKICDRHYPADETVTVNTTDLTLM